MKVGNDTCTYILYGDRYAKLGSDLAITAVDGKKLVLGTDYDYPVSIVNYGGSSYEIGMLKIYTDRQVEIKNADSSAPVQDYIVAANTSDKCNIVLAGVNISIPYLNDKYSALKVDGNTSADIILKNGTENKLKTVNGCGIEKNGTGELYIACESAGTSGHKCNDSCGKLEAATESSHAVIGTLSQSSGSSIVAQNICIAGGNIKATSSSGAAIGGGQNVSADGITIKGGIIYAETGDKNAAIGSGSGSKNGTQIYASNIRIENCDVTAQNTSYGGAAIGGGLYANASGITISGANVKAIVSSGQGAAIGSGRYGNCDGVTITDSVVYCETTDGAAVIGGGKYGTGDNIIIYESIVSLNSYGGKDVIGNGIDEDGSQPSADASNIVISRSSVKIDTAIQNQSSPIKNDATPDPDQVYLLTIANPDGAKIRVDGSEVITKGYNNTAADPNDTNVYLWLVESENHKIELVYADGNTTTYTYHFNPARRTDINANAFNLCRMDTISDRVHDENGHWFKCGGSDTCTVKYDYEAHRYFPMWESDDDGHWRICSVCGAESAKDPHVSGGPATETDPEICIYCGFVITPKSTHVHADHLTVVDAKKATCIEDGNKQYFKCSCGKLYADSTAKNEITLADVTIKATGHKFGNWVITKPATTSSTGVKTRTCTVCGMIETDTIPKKSSGGSGGGPSRPSDPTTPAESKPSINGVEKSWAEIAADIAKLPSGGTAVINMSGQTIVPADVIKAIRDTKSKIEFVNDSSKSWLVDGSKIITVSAADFSILPGTADKSALRGVTGADITINDTGVPADLELTFRKEFAGQFANLYKLTDGKLVFQSCVKVGENGAAVISGAVTKGEYVVMVCEFSDRPGDMNNDGVLNALDASAILKAAIGSETGINPLMADFNGDGAVNALDASAILKWIIAA